MRDILHSTANVALREAPINPEWIKSGNPMARNRLLSRSRDTTACTIAWDCTAGEFDWHYDFDETVYVIEGSVTISDGKNAARRLTPGDVVFFPAGSVAHWHVDEYVRKVAFCRRVLPRPLELLVMVLRRVKSLLRGGVSAGAGLMSADHA